MARVLVLGSGRRRIPIGVSLPEDADIVTVDQDGRLNPDLVCRLGQDRLMLADDSIDLVLALHVLEHIGRQGETAEWFFFWEDLYRVMKADAAIQFEAPTHTSVWAWADPSHVRVLSPEAFVFFSQESYRLPDSAISPFRIRCDLRPIEFVLSPNHETFRGTLRAEKPLMLWWETEMVPAGERRHGDC